ncbi:MAG: sigma 54-interacting transcriptional regulator [Desulfamplus sp.]|nr:sigma 54-interacting transcriptional regulator [Desulfamplus sp.]
MLGTVKSDLIGQPASRYIFREDQDIYYIHCKQCSNTGEPTMFDLRLVRKDGSSLSVHINLRSILVDAHGDSTVFLLVMSDITERKRTEIAEKKTQIAEAALSRVSRLKNQLEAEKEYLQEEIKLELNYQNIIGQSDAVKYVIHKIEQIATSNTTVLILGETGTGKELVARALHNLSNLRNRAMLKINCAALPSNLIESELFGHEKGSFTGANRTCHGRFEVANGSTLFMDEIGELPLELQAKLLRVLQDGEFERIGSHKTIKTDARIITATNRNLEIEMKNGRFRDDLFYRLNVFPIIVPPLRDRIDDIPLLAYFYLGKISRRLGKTIQMIPHGVINALQSYHWPGNIRELQNVLERGVINSSGNELRLAEELQKLSGSPVVSSSGDSGILTKTMQEVERDYIIQILEQTQWKVSGKNSASEILGLERSTLRARMRKLGIKKL